MLYWLGEKFGIELLGSRIILSTLGMLISCSFVWLLLPRCFKRLPSDRGRSHTLNPEAARGKPTGAGLVFVPIFIVTAFFVVPFESVHLLILGCVFLALASGYLDDRCQNSWGEYRKAGLDLLISIVTAIILCGWQPVTLWLPFLEQVFVVSPVLYMCYAVPLLWVSINATNCSDGVDGLSGSLMVLAYFYLGALLYIVVGHFEIAPYFAIPHNSLGSNWGIMAFSMLGALVGYLWFNAPPSFVLMGDAGSRPLGLLLGILVLVSGNPTLILVVAGVVMVNGGTGLVKVALLRFFKIGILSGIRFPLHDHCCEKLKWSKSQVLMRFVLLQAVLTPVLFVILLKMRW